jgi:hypothetical protein
MKLERLEQKFLEAFDHRLFFAGQDDVVPISKTPPAV